MFLIHFPHLEDISKLSQSDILIHPDVLMHLDSGKSVFKVADFFDDIAFDDFLYHLRQPSKTDDDKLDITVNVSGTVVSRFSVPYRPLTSYDLQMLMMLDTIVMFQSPYVQAILNYASESSSTFGMIMSIIPGVIILFAENEQTSGR